MSPIKIAGTSKNTSASACAAFASQPVDLVGLLRLLRLLRPFRLLPRRLRLLPRLPRLLRLLPLGWDRFLHDANEISVSACPGADRAPREGHHRVATERGSPESGGPSSEIADQAECGGSVRGLRRDCAGIERALTAIRFT